MNGRGWFWLVLLAMAGCGSRTDADRSAENGGPGARPAALPADAATEAEGWSALIRAALTDQTLEEGVFRLIEQSAELGNPARGKAGIDAVTKQMSADVGVECAPRCKFKTN